MQRAWLCSPMFIMLKWLSCVPRARGTLGSVRSVLPCCATGFTSVFHVGFWSVFGDPLRSPTWRCADVASIHPQCFLQHPHSFCLSSVGERSAQR